MNEALEEKKARKKAQYKKNRLHQELFQIMRLRRGEEDRVKALEEDKKPKPAQNKNDSLDDKVASIRNRLTGQKRISRERWNRFAGTGGEGGRGL